MYPNIKVFLVAVEAHTTAIHVFYLLQEADKISIASSKCKNTLKYAQHISKKYAHVKYAP